MIRSYQHLKRLLFIHRTLHKYKLDQQLLAESPVAFLLPLQWLAPWTWQSRFDGERGEAIRLALETLGPIFIKFGQALSTRLDLLPPDIAQELIKLQDKVPPFDSEQAMKLIESQLDKPISELYRHFDAAPLASASIAQVHTAQLHDGTDVVVKVVRPDILPVIKLDTGILRTLARITETLIPFTRRLHPVEVVAEFEKTILDELDLMREAANAALLKRNFDHSPLLYVPEIYWSHTATQVMTMERIFGSPVSDVDALRAQGVSIEKLSENGVIIFFTQVFKHNFFHADMHPGNIFVLPDGRYAAIDFGIMGTLTPEDQRYLAENFLAFFNRDYWRVAQLHIDSNWVGADTRVNELEAAIRSVCEPIFDRPLKDISFGLVLLRLFQVARRFKMEVQPQLVLLQKTLLNIEGLGRQLNDELDLWKTAKPFLQEWMNERLGPKGFVRGVKEQLPFLMENLPQLPAQHQAMMKTLSAQLPLQSELLNRMAQEQATTRRSQQRLALGLSLVLIGLLLPPSFVLAQWQQISLVALGLLLMVWKSR
ncbi:MAG TPA: ubiquinone biosynthesis regulatory protein kinase UbiB [Thiotrichales bacterium]|nr:MAG: ubiquinone biosynthesis regulatory protein kinase UbiB [Thiotrichales bacterium 35-46-9]OZA75393.1 MAG: ubiquinone biosynthesis regulatory protein kinase UbiB [Thiotrichales bacterium 39-47-5]UCG18599.1 MAG: ubiquinone biosynthesis regulatory protein kinase UbiB [Thiotrichales bacterium]HQR81799.1 ubiquinone biosynthesis regulatory protein kinase UbiB [Thiotrichales bacterium]